MLNYLTRSLDFAWYRTFSSSINHGKYDSLAQQNDIRQPVNCKSGTYNRTSNASSILDTRINSIQFRLWNLIPRRRRGSPFVIPVAAGLHELSLWQRSTFSVFAAICDLSRESISTERYSIRAPLLIYATIHLSL